MKRPEKSGIMAELTLLLRSIPSLTVALFIVATITMNLLANKSLQVPFSWLALDCGIIVSWIVFLTMDITTRQFGPRAANLLSVVAIAVNLGMCLVFFVGSRLPGVWGESWVEGSEAIINTALDHTFGGTWYVLLGSSVAFLVSALVNNFLNWRIGRSVERQGHRSFGAFAARSYISTFAAQFVDNLTFALIVSHRFFGWTLLQCFTCAVTGAVVELLCEVIFSPMGYRIACSWQEDGVGEAYLRRYSPAGMAA